VLIAYNAKLQVGSGEIQAAQLHYNIRDKIGTAVITEDGKDVMVQLDGVEAKHLERTQDPEVYRDEYRFMELTNSTTQILANSIIVNPGREVLFTHAKVYVGANKLMSMPFYSLDMLRQGGIFNDQMFGVNQDGVSLDLPYYVSLGPRQSSSLRLRSQYTGGRTYTSSRGTTLDWVTKYSDNDAYSGDFTINDLSSDHFGATIRHTQNFSKNLHGYFLLDSPRHESLYGYANLSHEFSNYRASFSMSGSRGLTRTTSNDRRADFSIDTNAKKLFGGLISHSIGVTTSYHQYDGSSAPIVQQGYGLRYRVRTAQARFGFGSVGAGLTMTKLWGSNQVSGVGLIGNISSAMTITPTATMTVNYEYNQGQSGPGIFGRQRISTGLLGEFGSFSTSAYLSRSLDENFVTLFLDNSIQLSKTWRIAYSYTGDSALGSSFKDYSFVIGFRIGIREIGLRWSYLTNRIGFELLSAGF
jgi:hypothetical protein